MKWYKYADTKFKESDLPVWAYYPDRDDQVRLVNFMGNEMSHWAIAHGVTPKPPTLSDKDRSDAMAFTNWNQARTKGYLEMATDTDRREAFLAGMEYARKEATT